MELNQKENLSPKVQSDSIRANHFLQTNLYSHHDTTIYLDIDGSYIETSDNFSFNISIKGFH